MITFSTDIGEFRVPDADELTFSQVVDARQCFETYDARAKDEHDLDATSSLLDGLLAAGVTGDLGKLLPYSDDPEELTLDALSLALTATVSVLRDAPAPTEPITWRGRTFDPERYATYGGTVAEIVETDELSRYMPTGPLTSPELTQAFYGLTLRQLAVVFRPDGEDLPTLSQARADYIQRNAGELNEVPAAIAFQITKAIALFVYASTPRRVRSASGQGLSPSRARLNPRSRNPTLTTATL